MRNKLLILSSLLLGTLLVTGAGCTTTTTNTNTANTNATTVAVDDDTSADDADDVDADDTTTDPTIEITSPVDGATVATTFDVSVLIDDFTLAPDKVEGENAAGEGHYHVWVDGEYFAAGVAATTTLVDVAVGEHEIMVSLQNNDHSDLTAVIKSEPITVTVEATE